MKVFSEQQKKLYKRNYHSFKKKFPSVIHILDQDMPSNVELWNEDGQVDVLINGSRFYGIDGHLYTEKQIESFIEKPGIVEGNPPGATEERTPTHLMWLNKFDAAFKKRIVVASLERQRIDCSTTFVFGIGLGFHIYPLLAHTRCRELIIVEPEPIFLKLSLYFIDWTEIFSLLKDRVVFILERSPEKVLSACRWHIHALNPGVQQAFFYYQHYWGTEIDAVYKHFMDKCYLFFDGLGFYDDEKVMTRNHLLNTYMSKWRMCSPSKRSLNLSAVIVGAGPSLQNDIEWLRENQSDLIIFSGGSALQALLRNGILPDFHVEIENIALNYDILEPLFRDYDLSKLILIPSSTMDTKSANLFGRRLWFMREGIMATAAHGGHAYALLYQNPTVVNTALSAALCLGFRNLLLLGADFGTIDVDKHHVPDTSYETVKELKNVSFKFPDEVKGNFGGTCYTNTHLMNGINATNNLLSHYKTARVYNGSHGAYVKNTIPIRSKSFKYQGPLHSKSVFIDSIYENSDLIEWDELLGESSLDDMKKDFVEHVGRMKIILSRELRKNKNIISLLSDYYVSIVNMNGPGVVYNPALTGSITTLTVIMLHWWRRVYAQDLNKMEKQCRRYLGVFLNIVERDFCDFIDQVRQELPLVRPELFDDKGNLIVEAKSSAQNAE